MNIGQAIWLGEGDHRQVALSVVISFEGLLFKRDILEKKLNDFCTQLARDLAESLNKEGVKET